MRRPMLRVLLVIAAWSAGCGPMAGQATDATGPSPDAAAPDSSDADAPRACPAVEVPADWTYPAGPYGTQVGQRIADFTLDDCDGRPVRFGDLVGSSQAVLVVVAAGWCSSCVQEARVLEATVHDAFCARGLRVLQVLFEDATGHPPDGLFCRDWRDTFGLAFPVVVDPAFSVQPWFDGAVNGQTPLNLLVDRQGVIRYRAAGPVPADLGQRIDGLVPR